MGRFSYPLLFLSIVFVLYSPILFAGFAGDDVYQLVRQSFFHDAKNIFAIFGEVIVSPTGHDSLTGFFYRPFTFAFYTLIYSVFNGNPLPFHIIQLFLYACAVYLLFIFFKSFFSKKIALILSLIFLIHPANDELAAYIAAVSDTFCLIFGISALILIGRIKKQSLIQTVIICFLLLMSLLSKETGAIFVILAVIYAGYKKELKHFLIPLIVTTVVYVPLRIHASSQVMFTYLPHPVTYNNFAEHIYLSIQIAYAFYQRNYHPDKRCNQTARI